MINNKLLFTITLFYFLGSATIVAEDYKPLLEYGKLVAHQTAKIFTIISAACLAGSIAVSLGANSIPETVEPAVTYAILTILTGTGTVLGGLGGKKLYEKIVPDDVVDTSGVQTEEIAFKSCWLE